LSIRTIFSRTFQKPAEQPVFSHKNSEARFAVFDDPLMRLVTHPGRTVKVKFTATRPPPLAAILEQRPISARSTKAARRNQKQKT
jgi:hypothetical protein